MTIFSTSNRRDILRQGAAFVGAAALGAGRHTAFAADTIKVVGIYTQPIEQQWIGKIHTALSAAKARGDIAYSFSERVSNADYERVMRQYAEQSPDLIVGESFAVESAARQVAKDYPKIAFLIGSSGKPQAPNFSVFDNYIQEAAYLTGILAGGLTKSNIIGMVGGYPIPEVNRLMHAFMAGAQAENPKVKFLVSFIGSWFDPPKAKEAAFAMIDRGADIMYAERQGVTEAAKERGKLAFGNVIDTQSDYPNTVVASAVWDMGPTVDTAIAKVKAKNFTAEEYGKYSGLRYKGSSLSPLGTFEGKVPAELVGKVSAAQQAILDGKLGVKVVETEPKSTV
jgi:basic membrane protein A and related proteins